MRVDRERQRNEIRLGVRKRSRETGGRKELKKGGGGPSQEDTPRGKGKQEREISIKGSPRKVVWRRRVTKEGRKGTERKGERGRRWVGEGKRKKRKGAGEGVRE